MVCRDPALADDNRFDQAAETDPRRIKTIIALRYLTDYCIDDLYTVADTYGEDQEWYQHREDPDTIVEQNQQAELPNDCNRRTEKRSNGRIQNLRMP